MRDVLGETMEMTHLMLMLRRHMVFHNLREREAQVRKALIILEGQETLLIWKWIVPMCLTGGHCEFRKQIRVGPRGTNYF
jgi:hypothetical protein